MKLIHYLRSRSSIYQTKYCETTFLTLPRTAYITFNRPVASKTTLLCKKSQQSYYYYRIATQLAKTYLYLLLQFQ